MDTKQIMLVLEQERTKAGKTLHEWADWLDVPISSYNAWLYRYREPVTEHLMRVLDRAGYELIVRRKP